MGDEVRLAGDTHVHASPVVVSHGRRVLVRAPTCARLARLVENLWHREATFALIKPGTSSQQYLSIVDQYDPGVIVDGSQDPWTVIERPAMGPHPPPVGDGDVTVFTSGTTGPPKGIVLSRAAISGNARKTARLHGFGQNRPHGTCLAFFHVNALVMSLIGTLETGETLIVGPSDDPDSLFGLLAKHKARTASVNPRVLRQIVEVGPRWPASLDYLITAAGPLSRFLAEEFHGRYGSRLRQGFGLSEAVNFSFVMPLLRNGAFKEAYLEGRPPVGLPVEGTEYVIDDGRLLIRSPDVMKGYLGSTESPFIGDRWLVTGDFASLRAGYLVLGGRVAEAIRGKSRIQAPAQIEDQVKIPFHCGEYAVARIPMDQEDGLSLFTGGKWCDELEALLDGLTPRFDLLCAGGLRLSEGGKVQRSLMSDTATAVLGFLDANPQENLAAAFPGIAGVMGYEVGCGRQGATHDLVCGCEQVLVRGGIGLVAQPRCNDWVRHLAEYRDGCLLVLAGGGDAASHRQRRTLLRSATARRADLCLTARTRGLGRWMVFLSTKRRS